MNPPLSVAVALLGLVLASWIEIPMIPVPITLQTYAVLVIGAFLGWRLGLSTIALYLGCAAAGLPVLAGGASGIERLTGPTGGYLVGFAVTVVFVGLMARARVGREEPRRSVATMVVGQAITVLFGACWLALQRDWVTAWNDGVQPFVVGVR